MCGGRRPQIAGYAQFIRMQDGRNVIQTVSDDADPIIVFSKSERDGKIFAATFQ